MDSFKILYTFLGGLGLFFYGMRTMSDSLQSMAGDVIKKVINSLTTNRLMAVVIGMVVTMIVQSSSVTTVMVVGFVNASLMSLTQAIGVIFGSNIGTTITGWIISIKIGKYGLLLVAIGIFPMMFANNAKLKNIGRVFFGVGLIFFGLDTMSNAFKPLRSNQEFLQMISYFSDNNYPSFIASTLIGCLLTFIVQSSSAMLGITIALASTSIISFHTAVALVLGENIGTTITALLASVGANSNAKRAAKAHALFNLFGVLLIYTVLPYYIDFIDWLIPGDPNLIDASGERPLIAKHIAAFHSIFNITATICFVPFINQFAKIVIKLTPETKDSEHPHLIMLGSPSDVMATTAIVQVNTEMKKFKDILDRMYKVTKSYVSNEAHSSKELAKINDYENITDNIQKEVTVFLCKVMEKRLTSIQTIEVQTQIRIADEFESIADYLCNVANYCHRMEKKFDGTEEQKEFLEYLNEVWAFFDHCSGYFDGKASFDITQCERESEKLRILANDIRDRHLERIKTGEHEALSVLTYSDMVVALRKIRAHALNVAQATDALRKADK